MSSLRVTAAEFASILLEAGRQNAPSHETAENEDGARDAELTLPHPYALRCMRGRHFDTVYSVAFSVDGKTVASGSGDGTARLWDTATGREAKTLFWGWDEPPGCGWSVLFSPDGTMLASGSGHGMVKLWDPVTGQLLRKLRSSSATEACRLAFSPDSTVLAAGSDNGTIQVYETATGCLRGELDDQINWSVDYDPGTPHGISFSPDGATILTVYGLELRLWDAKSCRLLQTIDCVAVSIVAFSPDGTAFANAINARLELVNIATGQRLRTLADDLPSTTRGLAFSPDGVTMASCSDDKTIRLWDVATGQLLRTLVGHFEAVLSVAFSLDGDMVASGCSDGSIWLWDASRSSG